jgi:hypothetical protein
VPEVTPEGEILPMVNSMTPAGPDFSNITVENVSINMGVTHKFSGLSAPSDVEIESEVDMVFPGMYIRLKGRKKKNQIPEANREAVDALFEGGMKAPLKQSPPMGLMQVILFTYNGEQLAKPRPKQVLFLTTTAIRSLNACLTEAYKQNIDVFSPDSGRLVKLEPYTPEGLTLVLFRVSLLDVSPIKPDICKKLWVPWGDAFKRMTYDDHIKTACKCFGRSVVRLAFQDDVDRVCDSSTAEAAPVRETPVKVVTENKVECARPSVPAIDVDVELPVDGPLDCITDEDEIAPVKTGEAAPPASPEQLAAYYEKMLEGTV